jgi:membrane peptidoglycan carboxypeptidase
MGPRRQAEASILEDAPDQGLRVMPRRFPSLKRFLFKTHRDLGTICDVSGPYPADKLTVIEKIILLLEDRRFLQHRGIDLRAVVRESVRFISRQKHGGASTIDMQFVRTQTGFRQHTLTRKLYEMWLAFFLQYRMDKKAILRAYLEIVYLGTGLTGIGQAAYELFNKSVEELCENEAAFIAAMMVYPRPTSEPPSWRKKVERRAAYGSRLLSRFGQRYE